MDKFLKIFFVPFIFFSCNLISTLEDEDPETPDSPLSESFYVLNEGNMLANQCTLDFYDAVTGEYTRNVLQGTRPGDTGVLGDVGNDLQLYDGRLFAVVNGSDKVEVYDAESLAHVGTLAVESPRYIVFDGNYAYVSSYSGKVMRFDVRTLTAAGSAEAGMLPEEMAIYGGRLFVANSGDFADPTFRNTITVIDLASFSLVGEIDAYIQLHHLAVDARGTLWASSRGNYSDKPACLLAYIPNGNDGYSLAKTFDVPVTNMSLCGDTLYYIAASYDEHYVATYSFGSIDTASMSHNTASYITDGSEATMMTPYAVALRPDGSFYITDVAGYTGTGTVRAYSADGRVVSIHAAAQIPGHLVFP